MCECGGCIASIRKYHIPITWCTAFLATVGVVLLAVGAAQLGTAEKSTALEVIQRFANFYESTEKDDMRQAVVTFPVTVSLRSAIYNWTAVSKSGVSSAQSFEQLYWAGSVARDTAAETQSVSVNFVNNVQGSVASTVVSPAVPLVHPTTGRHLSELCFVVKREELRSNPYLLDTNYPSCYYPFTLTSNRYEATTASGTLTVKIISFGDPSIPISLYSEGTGVVTDRDVTLVSGYALPMLIVGIALTVVMLPLTWFVVIYCWTETPQVMKHIAFSILCCCCVSQEFPVKDPLQVATGSGAAEAPTTRRYGEV